MWFDDEDISGRRRFSKKKRNRRRGTILMVNPRSRDRRRVWFTQTAVYILVPIALAAVVATVWIGLHLVGQALYSENAVFTIHDVRLIGGTDRTRALIGSMARFEGTNLFAVDIGELRDELLEGTPHIKGLRIMRCLPDELAIEIDERVAVAQMERRSRTDRQCAVDSSGYLFGKPPDDTRLPLIKGYRGGDLSPGKSVGGIAYAALELIEECDAPDWGVTIRSVDVSDEEALDVRMSRGGVEKTVFINWDDMGARDTESGRSLCKKLGLLLAAWDSPKGRSCTTLDATYDDEVVAK